MVRAAIPAFALLTVLCVPGSSADDATVHRFEGLYQIDQTEVYAGSTFSFGENCLMFDDAVHVVRGSATVTWTPNLPASPRMELVLLNGNELIAVGSGLASASIEFADYDVVPELGASPLAWQIASDEPAGMVVDLRGTLHLVVDYTGAAAFEPDANWGCAIGH